MKWLEDIRRKIGEYFLKQEIKNNVRNSSFESFENAKSIGVIFDVGVDREDFELIKKYIKYLKDSKKRVRAIGFFNLKEVPDNLSYNKADIDLFSRSELDFYLRPGVDISRSFISEEFDMLIDLNYRNVFPLYYIAVQSKAKFKIGRYNGHNVYDLMIELPEEDKGLKYYMRYIDTYIQQIKGRNENRN